MQSSWLRPALKAGPEKGQAVRAPPVPLKQSRMPRSFRMNAYILLLNIFSQEGLNS
jgi:hypothetical protein